MANKLETADFLQLKSKCEAYLGGVHQLTVATGNEEMISVITDLRSRWNDPYMFVIVGEVKAGKSSFINALLDADEEICAVAPSPMTDTIQQITYGTEAHEVEINPYLKRVYRPVEILREIAIVDTPGTNTIIEHHQEITERFIPASDLIIFVFEAKNPYRQSAWDFFKLINDDWHKKIIFVLQQKDLMNEADLKINIDGVHDFAEQNGMEAPRIFAVSAKDEQDGKKDISGFEPLRAYIQKNITGGRAPLLKIESNLSTTQTFLTQIEEALLLRKRQLELDIDFRKEIQQILDEQANRSHRQVNLMNDHLLQAFDNIWSTKRAELNQALSFFSLVKRSFNSIFNKNQSLKIWLSNFSEDLEKDIKVQLFDRLGTDVDDLAEAIQNMIKFIDLKIQNTTNILSKDVAFFREIVDQRTRILADLQSQFHAFVQNQNNFKNDRLFPKSQDMAPNVATGSGIAIIGVVLAAVTHTSLMDITGGIMTAIGLMFAGITVGLNKRKVLRQFDEEMQKGRDNIEAQLTSNLHEYINNMVQRINSYFEALDQHIEEETKTIEALQSRWDILYNERTKLEQITQTQLAQIDKN